MGCNMKVHTMAHASGATDGDITAGAETPVRAQLAIEPNSETGCVVANVSGDTQDVTHQLKSNGYTDSSTVYGECHTELALEDSETQERAYLTSTATADCICPVFDQHDCIPEMEGVRSGTIVISLTVPRHEVLREIIAELQATGATVSVDWLVNGNRSDAVAEIDVSTITDKQREAMETAMDMGYYETPRGADLGDLADELAVSKSAVSQRLNAAERKLVTAFLAE